MLLVFVLLTIGRAIRSQAQEGPVVTAVDAAGFEGISTNVAQTLKTKLDEYQAVKTHVLGLKRSALAAFSSSIEHALHPGIPSLHEVVTLRPMLLFESIFPFNSATAKRQSDDLTREVERFDKCMQALRALDTLPSEPPSACLECETGACVVCTSCDAVMTQGESIMASFPSDLNPKLAEIAYFGRVYIEAQTDGVEFSDSADVLAAAVDELKCAGNQCVCSGAACLPNECSHEAAGTREEDKDALAKVNPGMIADLIQDLSKRNRLRLARFQAKVKAWTQPDNVSSAREVLSETLHVASRAPAKFMSFMSKPLHFAMGEMMKVGSTGMKMAEGALKDVKTDDMIRLMILLAPGKYKGDLAKLADAVKKAEDATGKIQPVEEPKQSLGSRIAGKVGVQVDNSTGTMLLASVIISVLVGVCLMCM